MTAAMLIVIASPAVAQQEFAQLDGCWSMTRQAVNGYMLVGMLHFHKQRN
jgi:hypothetical protein